MQNHNILYASPGYLQVLKNLNKNGESIFSNAQGQLRKIHSKMKVLE